MTQELAENTHYWAVVSEKAAVVLWDGEVFRIAGDWEGPVKVDRVVCRIHGYLNILVAMSCSSRSTASA